MKRIVMKNNNFAIVDDEDYEHLVAIGGWYKDRRGYAITDKIIKGKRTIIDMHRLLHPPSKGFITDHMNQNKLDNRKINLRDATKSLNALNSGMWSNNKSGYKGVCWSARNNKWRAYINHNGRQLHLGFFKNIKDAAEAYANKSQELLNA